MMLMNRKMAMILIITLLLTAAAVGCGVSEEADLQWGADRDEITETMGPCEDEWTPESEEYTVLRYPEQEILGYRCTISFAFRKGAMFCRMYSIEDRGKGAFGMIGTELSRIYEGYADDPQSVVDCLEMMEPDMKDIRKQMKGGAISWQVYKPAEDTNVILIHISAKNCTFLYYIQPKDQME